MHADSGTRIGLVPNESEETVLLPGGFEGRMAPGPGW